MGLCAGEKVYFCMGAGRPNRVKVGGPGRPLSPARPWRRDVPRRGAGGECRGGGESVERAGNGQPGPSDQWSVMIVGLSAPIVTAQRGLSDHSC